MPTIWNRADRIEEASCESTRDAAGASARFCTRGSGSGWRNSDGSTCPKATGSLVAGLQAAASGTKSNARAKDETLMGKHNGSLIFALCGMQSPGAALTHPNKGVADDPGERVHELGPRVE